MSATATPTMAAGPAVTTGGDGAVRLSIFLGAAVIALMMVFGFLMRAAQGAWIDIDPALFYQLMTAHGAGMVGAAGLTGATIMWYFLGRHVPLTPVVFTLFLGLFLLGVVLVLAGIFLGGYAGAWTFLFPLPAQSGGLWEPWAAVVFLLGYTSIGVAFLLLHLEVGRQIIAAWGGIGRAMAWPLAFGGGRPEEAPPPTVVAVMAVTIFNTLGIVVGAAVLVASIVNLLFPGFAVDALLAKNMIFFFGHVFINASIYMAVIAIYEIMPEYFGKPYPTTRALALSWTAILLFVMAVYPHHLLQDAAMPAWSLVLGQVVSYLSGIPILAVTAFGILTYLFQTRGMRWDLTSSLLVLGVVGWTAGAAPAILDGMLVVNKVMHNTQWVPGHFHTYLILGEVAMAFGFMAWLARGEPGRGFAGLTKLGFWLYALGGAAFVTIFLVAGTLSVPRRWAAHLPEWVLLDRIGTVAAALVILGVLVFIGNFLSGVLRRRTG